MEESDEGKQVEALCFGAGQPQVFAGFDLLNQSGRRSHGAHFALLGGRAAM